MASISFVLLTATARTSELRVHGTAERNFRAAYDILVRPRGSLTGLERRERLVRDNYLSGIFGGITLHQYHQIEHLPGVRVAAPIANIGYLLLNGTVHIRLNDLVDSEPYQVYRVHVDWLADRGTSRYPMTDDYVYFTRRDRFVLWPPGNADFTEVVSGRTHPIPVCQGFTYSAPGPTGPFDPANDATLSCYSARGSSRAETFEGERPGAVEASFPILFPILLSAIDPVQEAKLVHLDHTIVSGRYLRESDRVRETQGPLVPVIASTRTYVSDALSATIQRLQVPTGISLPNALVAGACKAPDVPCPREFAYRPPRGSHREAFQFLAHLKGRTIAQRRYPVGPLYQDALPALGHPLSWSQSYWIPSGVRYRTLGRDHLQPRVRPRSQGIWFDPFNGSTGYFVAPTDNEDTQFQALQEIPGSNRIVNGRGVFPALVPVGRFDPRKLPGFSPLSRVPLETYYPPELEPANAKARAALRGRPLLPSQNLGGYIQQPPLLLTTLRALPALFDRQAFPTVPRKLRRAPISVIRVRVGGVTGPNALSEARIRTVAQLIHDRTGLQVDITAGSSPHPMLISLPAGRFGRPRLLLREGWTKKGVSISFLRALDRKDAALFALILVVCCFFLANGALASVRQRRRELGTLLALGWSRWELFAAVLLELVVIGVCAGILGAGVAALLVWTLHLALPLLDAFYVLPLGVGLTLVGGLIPAWRAARLSPLAAILPPLTGGRRGGRARTVVGMALWNLARLPSRTLVGGLGLVLGVAALTFLLGIERAFQGVLVGTLLGHAVSLQVRGADFVALGLTVALAVFSVADVLYLNLRERQAEMVTFRASGWSQAELRSLVACEALLLGLASSLAGALLGVALAAEFLAVPARSLAEAAAITLAVGTLACLVASLAPLSQLRKLLVPEVLAAE